MQYVEAILVRGIVKFFLNPVVSGLDNIKKLVTLADENRVSVVIIANHINAYDPLYISAVLARETGRRLYPVWLPAKKRFFNNRFKCFAMDYHGCLPIGIGKDEDSLRSMKVIIDKVRAADVICVFPEGGVTPDGNMGPDLGFVTFLARRSRIIVQPVRLSGIIGFDTDWNRMLRRKFQLKISFGSPVIIEKGSTVNSMEMIADIPI